MTTLTVRSDSDSKLCPAGVANGRISIFHIPVSQPFCQSQVSWRTAFLPIQPHTKLLGMGSNTSQSLLLCNRLVSSDSPWVHHLIGNYEHCMEGMATTFWPLPELPIEFYLKILSFLQPISSSKHFWTTSSGVTAMPSPPTNDYWCCFPLKKYQHKRRACKGHRLLAHGFGELSSQAAGSILLGLTTSYAPRHTSGLTFFNWPQQLHAKLAKCEPMSLWWAPRWKLLCTVCGWPGLHTVSVWLTVCGGPGL